MFSDFENASAYLFYCFSAVELEPSRKKALMMIAFEHLFFSLNRYNQATPNMRHMCDSVSLFSFSFVVLEIFEEQGQK